MKELLPIFFKYLLAPILLVVMVFIISSIKSIKGKLSIQKVIIFILLTGLVLAIPGLLGLLRYEFVWGGLVITVILYMGLGFAYWGISKTNINARIGIQESLTAQIIVLIVCSVLGGWLYYMLFSWLSQLPFAIWSMTNIMWFIVPYLILMSKEYFTQIPAPIYTPWMETEGTLDRDSRDRMSSFEAKPIKVKIKRKVGDPVYASFLVRLPNDISLGNWFNWFVDDQNRLFPQDPIENSRSNAEIGWLFYTAKWLKYPIFIRVLDPRHTSVQNKIKKDRTIYIRRVQTEKKVDNNE